MAFSETNLRAGLDALKLTASSKKARYDKAIAGYVEATTEKATLPVVAIENELKEAVKGLSNSGSRLEDGLKAAGINPTTKLMAKGATATTRVVTATPTPTQPVKVPDSTTSEPSKKSLSERMGDVGDTIARPVRSNLGLFLSSVFLGLILGAIFRIICSDLFDLAYNAPVGWVIFCVMSVLFSFLAFTILLRLRERAEAREAHYKKHLEEVHEPALSA